MAKSAKFNPGDRVALSARFLKSIGAGHAAASRRGTYLRDHESLPNYGYMKWDDTDARMAAREGNFAEDDYCQYVRDHGELICTSNLARVGSAAFGDTYA